MVWLALCTLIQALFTIAATIAIWQSHEGSVADLPAHPIWTNVLSFMCISFMSINMGLQAIMRKRVSGISIFFAS
jgi:hypothetical protein